MGSVIFFLRRRKARERGKKKGKKRREGPSASLWGCYHGRLDEM